LIKPKKYKIITKKTTKTGVV
jgi:hypothetical protein